MRPRSIILELLGQAVPDAGTKYRGIGLSRAAAFGIKTNAAYRGARIAPKYARDLQGSLASCFLGHPLRFSR